MSTSDSTCQTVPYTFSGTHPYNPEHVVSSVMQVFEASGLGDCESAARIYADTITEKALAGVCPRCDGRLTKFENQFPSGSRVTLCRCVPICSRCGQDEGDQELLGHGRLSEVWTWPLRKGDMTRRRNKVLSRSRPGVIISDGKGDLAVLTDISVGQLLTRRHPGGWAEFGHDADHV